MEEIEIKTLLDGLKTDLEGKSKKEVEAAITAFETKHKDLVQKEAKTLFDKEIETVKGDLEKKFASDIKVVQDHADKLDMKLQKEGKNGKMEVKSFNEILKETIED